MKQQHKAHMKHTWSKLRAQVEHVYFQYVCFVVASCTLPRVNGVGRSVLLRQRRSVTNRFGQEKAW